MKQTPWGQADGKGGAKMTTEQGIKWTREAHEKAEIVNAIFTPRDSEIARDVIECCRSANMMGDGLGVIAQRFALSIDAIACWWYTQFYKS